eukprot:889029-Pyramimonas_sp.AAC.2
MNNKKKRPNKGKPVVAAPSKAAVACAPSVAAIANASSLAVDAGNTTPIMTEEGYSRSSEKTRTVENITTKSSDREMKAMLDMTDSETESDPSILQKNTEDIPGHNLLISHPPPAGAAIFLNKKDMWTKRGQ